MRLRWSVGVIVFVHGVPETAALWNKLRAYLDEPAVAVALPGFGCPRPAGFAATKDAYVDWLASELSGFGEPCHLVGHDWGAAFTMRIALTRPTLVASWAVDVAYLLHPDYVWHDFARAWQSPDEHDAFWDRYLSGPRDTVAGAYESWSVARDDALALAGMADATMAACIGDLYRSARPNPFADWGAAIHTSGMRGLVLLASDEPFGPEEQSVEVAERLGARTVELIGCGHWWPLQDPERAAGLLQTFWREIAA